MLFDQFRKPEQATSCQTITKTTRQHPQPGRKRRRTKRERDEQEGSDRRRKTYEPRFSFWNGRYSKNPVRTLRGARVSFAREASIDEVRAHQHQRPLFIWLFVCCLVLPLPLPRRPGDRGRGGPGGRPLPALSIPKTDLHTIYDNR